MDAQLRKIGTEDIPLVHHWCAQSVFWEMCPDSFQGRTADFSLEKEAWLASRLLEQGSCGFNLVHERPGVAPIRAIATILFCPRSAAPGAVVLPTAPVSSDAYLLSSLHIDPVIARTGLEAVLVDAVIMELMSKNVSAVEAFAFRPDFVEDPSAPLPEDLGVISRGVDRIGMMSFEILQAAGFYVHVEHPLFPRMRLDLPPKRGLLLAKEVEQLVLQN